LARKSPIRHNVRASNRKGKPVTTFDRGSGFRTNNPHSSGYTPPSFIPSRRDSKGVTSLEAQRVVSPFPIHDKIFGVAKEVVGSIKGLATPERIMMLKDATNSALSKASSAGKTGITKAWESLQRFREARKEVRAEEADKRREQGARVPFDEFQDGDKSRLHQRRYATLITAFDQGKITEREMLLSLKLIKKDII